MKADKIRCGWVGENKPYYEDYHDHEWGRPVHDDQKLFEMLILEGAQAGLNWETILKKRDGYRKVFKNFDVKKCAKLTDADLDKMLQDERIIRNRLKVYAVRKNALAFLEIQKEFGSFDAYLWAFVGGKQLQNKRKSLKDIPAQTDISEAISKDLKKRGMTFVGPTIIYAYMQAVGLVNDHITTCFCYKDCK
ncbi:MAG TPA: DNA-3-methyladenine glycosylase I [Alphaproteobacteria bacterium]|nr:DNA-3-methyladenine glycosylase I [Alphaproteobacteria bacterium]HOO51611.1 DNA-3-methyladenine glycosylase I [Alphaproteobacteria bacterium]